MSAFEDAVIQRIKQLEREVERLQRWERPTGGGVTDHGALTGLGDNDHPQYLLTTGKAADSDKLDGVDSTGFATATHNHTGTYLPIDGKAADSDKLDGKNSTDFASANHNHDHGSELTGLTDDDHTQYTKHPASSTDNAIARWDGTGGRTLQNSSVAIDDNGKLSGDGLDGWVYDTDAWHVQQISPTYQFKIVSKDVRYRFPKGTKIKLVQSGTTKYFYVIATAYTSGNTIITITGGSDYALANENISGQAYSYAAAPQGFPQWFNYTPTFTGFSTVPTGIHKFSVIGSTCFVNIRETSGTSNSTAFAISAPITPLEMTYFPIRLMDSGAWGNNPGLARINTTGVIDIYKDLSASGTTNSGSKYAQFMCFYEF